jgi:hypothetical protein
VEHHTLFDKQLGTALCSILCDLAEYPELDSRSVGEGEYAGFSPTVLTIVALHQNTSLKAQLSNRDNVPAYEGPTREKFSRRPHFRSWGRFIRTAGGWLDLIASRGIASRPWSLSHILICLIAYL